MKRFLAFLVALAIICPLTGCSQETVEITLQASYFSDKTDDEIATTIEELDCVSYGKNEDGSITVIFTESAYEKILKDIISTVDDTIATSITGADKIESFMDIQYNEGLTEFAIYVDADLYTEYYVVYAFAYFSAGAYYQNFIGIDSDDIDVKVSFVNYETNEILNSASYSDFV